MAEDGQPVISHQEWDYELHPGDCHEKKEQDGTWSVCCGECAGTGVFPMPRLTPEALVNLETDGCVNCKNTGRATVIL